jgi:hypothetical protein
MRVHKRKRQKKQFQNLAGGLGPVDRSKIFVLSKRKIEELLSTQIEELLSTHCSQTGVFAIRAKTVVSIKVGSGDWVSHVLGKTYRFGSPKSVDGNRVTFSFGSARLCTTRPNVVGMKQLDSGNYGSSIGERLIARKGRHSQSRSVRVGNLRHR